MKFKVLFFLPIIALLLASCAHIYTPVLYHQDIVYQPKPASFDSAKTVTYISAGFDGHSSVDYADDLESGQINISQGRAFKGFDLAYGAFGVAGDYGNNANKDKPNYFSDKFFGAVGGRASANLFVTSGRADVRFIGMEMAYSHEFGSFADFRKNIQNTPGYDVDTRTDLFTVGLTSEVIFHSINDNGYRHGIRLFLGTTFGPNDVENSDQDNETSQDRLFQRMFPKVSYFVSYKKYFGTAEFGNGFFIRLGVKF
jgi:hypothetical protein